jgi:hypothetical protein
LPGALKVGVLCRTVTVRGTCRAEPQQAANICRRRIEITCYFVENVLF